MKQERPKQASFDPEGWFISPELLSLSASAELAYSMADGRSIITAPVYGPAPIVKEGRKA